MQLLWENVNDKRARPKIFVGPSSNTLQFINIYKKKIRILMFQIYVIITLLQIKQMEIESYYLYHQMERYIL